MRGRLFPGWRPSSTALGLHRHNYRPGGDFTIWVRQGSARLYWYQYEAVKVATSRYLVTPWHASCANAAMLSVEKNRMYQETAIQSTSNSCRVPPRAWTIRGSHVYPLPPQPCPSLQRRVWEGGRGAVKRRHVCIPRGDIWERIISNHPVHGRSVEGETCHDQSQPPRNGGEPHDEMPQSRLLE